MKTAKYIIAIPIIFFVGFIGYRFMNQQDNMKELNKSYVALCKGERQCENRVKANFERCYYNNFKMGKRLNKDKLNFTGLNECLGLVEKN